MTDLPLYMKDAFGYPTGLAIGVGIGFLFGFVLERAGFGRANVLAAQFYLTDMRVLKVMFTAIVTALLGVTVLSGAGVLDLAALAVPRTYVWPQLVGGLLLGMGFVISGYCPGTGVVALASGKLDGLFAIFGVMVGSVLFGFMFPLFESFYTSGDLGVLRLPDILPVTQVGLAIGVTLMAIGAFVGAEKVERLVAARDHASPPPGSRPVQRRVFAGLVAGAGLALVALFVPQAESTALERTAKSIGPLELAERMVDDPASYYLVDLRVGDETTKRLPGALPATVDDPDAAFVGSLPSTRVLIVYDETGPASPPAATDAFGGEVFVLDGGYAAFASELFETPEPPEAASASAIERYRLRAALHAYLTGTETKPAPAVRPKAVKRAAAKKGSGC